MPQSDKKCKKAKIDDGFYPYLVKGAQLEGYMGIPKLMNIGKPALPTQVVPFDKIEQEANKNNFDAYVGFYLYDDKFAEIITSADEYIPLLKKFEGVITPDCTLLTGQSNCLQATNTYFNRAVGFYLQKHHIQVIPQVRWSDERSFDYCFLGIEKNSVVAISTYGCIRGDKKQSSFKVGLSKMLDILEPSDVIVYGAMPRDVFQEFFGRTRFHNYPNWTTLKHAEKVGEKHGSRQL